MATKSMTRTTSAKSTPKRNTAPKIKDSKVVVNNEEVTEVIIEDKAESVKKAYDPTDLIMCKSLCNGELLVVGEKTNTLYKWADFGDVQGMEYQDLIYMVRAQKSVFKYPYLLVLDDDIVDSTWLANLYDTLYDKDDFRAVLNLPLSQMMDAIEKMPKGAQDSLKGLVATAIEEGTFDSVQKIKALDSYFDTSLLLTLADN